MNTNKDMEPHDSKAIELKPGDATFESDLAFKIKNEIKEEPLDNNDNDEPQVVKSETFNTKDFPTRSYLNPDDVAFDSDIKIKTEIKEELIEPDSVKDTNEYQHLLCNPIESSTQKELELINKKHEKAVNSINVKLEERLLFAQWKDITEVTASTSEAFLSATSDDIHLDLLDDDIPDLCQNVESNSSPTSISNTNDLNVCKFCSAKCSTKTELKRHLSTVHFRHQLMNMVPKSAPYKCPVQSCSMIKKDRFSIAMHYGNTHKVVLKLTDETSLEEMAKVEPLAVVCKLCQQTFTNQRYLYTHMTQDHFQNEIGKFSK